MMATRHATAAVLDLRHRLPLFWGHVQGEPRGRGDLKADALALLANPHAAAALLDGNEAQPSKRRATVHVHLAAETLAGVVPGVARVEDIGPVLLEWLADLLGHRRITLKPVIDLNTGTSVNAYEHPTTVKERGELRNLRDVFPHSVSPPGVRTDHDHAAPYDPHGPPGQTGDHNDAPLTRRHHRAKTHLGHRVTQVGPGTYLWTTRHGLTRRVDPQGTTVVSSREAWLYEATLECRFVEPGDRAKA